LTAGARAGDTAFKAVDTAANIVKLSSLTVNPSPVVLQNLSSPLVEFGLKALAGDFG
jgi:hypothetical protein